MEETEKKKNKVEMEAETDMNIGTQAVTPQKQPPETGRTNLLY